MTLHIIKKNFFITFAYYAFRPTFPHANSVKFATVSHIEWLLTALY